MTPIAALHLLADKIHGSCSCTGSSPHPSQGLAKALWAISSSLNHSLYGLSPKYLLCMTSSGCCHMVTSFQAFHDCTSVVTLAFKYSAGGISNPSEYEELRFKFQMLYHLETWRLHIVIKSLLCTNIYFRSCGKAECHTSRATVFATLSVQNHGKHFHHWSYLQCPSSFRKKKK